MKINSLLSFFGLKSSQREALTYSQWINKVEPYLNSTRTVEFNDSLILSFILFVSSDSNDEKMKRSIASVVNQKSPNWELFIVGNCPIQDSSILEDQRIRFIPEKNNLNFFDSINSVSNNTLGEFITFLREGDELSEHAVTWLNYAVADNNLVRLIVTDEDLIDTFGQRSNPFFKPDWNPDYLLNYNYFSRAVIYDRKLFSDMGGFNIEESDPYHALALRATGILLDEQIYHIDKVLFHFKQKRADTLHRVKFGIPSPSPLLTVIIPTKDQLELLKVCVDGLLNNTTYDNIEVIIIDNKSEKSETLAYLRELKNNRKIKVLNYDKPFNYSEMNNLAVTKAKGSLLCFLNNDISMIKDDWLSEMVSQACRSEIGCVGAKLLYPDGTIQHAGVILGLKGYASHAHKGFAGDDHGYFNRLIVAHNVSAVTAACMVMRKDVFEEVGGFDAENLKIAYNDVDLCLKVREAGYRNLFTPHAQLIHHESKSRGKKRNKKQQKQLREESAFLVKKWGGVLTSDPAYNKNLTLLREDFSLGMDRLKPRFLS